MTTKTLLAAITLALGGVAASANATDINASNWGPCLGNTSCTVDGATLTGSATEKFSTDFTIPLWTRELSVVNTSSNFMGFYSGTGIDTSISVTSVVAYYSDLLGDTITAP